MIYFDNAASSWPKPPQVIDAVREALEDSGANPGRSGHRLARKAAGHVYEARKRLARFIGAEKEERVVFTANATEALNTAINGVLKQGDHVVTTVLEHNSMLRPLYLLKKKGVDVSIVSCDASGKIRPDQIEHHIKLNTKLVALTHASNVTGTIQPIAAIAEIARRRGVLLLVDAAQTAGAYPLDVSALGIDMLAMTGHKAFSGPQGTGALYVSPGTALLPLKVGGTGSFSELEQQPEGFPDYLESGTLNGPGLAGLAAALEFLEETGLNEIMEHEQLLLSRLVTMLRNIEGVIVYGHQAGVSHVPVVSFNIHNCDPAEVSFALDRIYDMAVRPGLHCAPLAHKALATYPQGTVRASLSYFNTLVEVDNFIEAIEQITHDL